MNEPQKRRIVATFQHVDELLRTALHALSGNGGDSPFNELIPDALPEQCRIVSEDVRLLRERMAFALHRLDIRMQSPRIPATHSALTHVLFAEVDIEDIDPMRMKGYGDLEPEDILVLKEICIDLRMILRRMQVVLDQDSDGSNCSHQ